MASWIENSIADNFFGCRIAMLLRNLLALVVLTPLPLYRNDTFLPLALHYGLYDLPEVYSSGV